MLNETETSTASSHKEAVDDNASDERGCSIGIDQDSELERDGIQYYCVVQ
jgi:hypothetical protein